MSRHNVVCFVAALVIASVVPALAEDLPLLPTDFGECPRELEPFLRYIVQRRAAEGLNAVVLSEKDPRVGTTWGDWKIQVGTVYGGMFEDANIAWTAAAAYRYPWSRFHRNELLRERAFFLMDTLARIRADGKWGREGLDAFFGLQAFAWAALSWIETGDVDQARTEKWITCVRLSAEDAMLGMHYGPYAPSALGSQYANPEFEYMAGLAAAWKLTGEERFREEGARVLRRYDDWLYEGGGMAYFLGSAPQHNYQQMVVNSLALYWDLTGDEHALEMLRRMAPYFPNVQHRTGLLTDAEHPQLKHSFGAFINPATPAMLGAILGDGPNRRAADAAMSIIVDGVMNRSPSSFDAKKFGLCWYNYQAAGRAAAALRVMERHPLPAPAALPENRVFFDKSFRGPRSQWDNFTAAVGTRPMNSSLAGAYLANPNEPLIPIDAAVDGVYFEVVQGKQKTDAAKPDSWASTFACTEWNPMVYRLTHPDFAAVSCLTWLCAPYWGDMPYLPGESSAASEVSPWTSVQHWAAWRDGLVGLGSLRCHADGGDAKTDDAVRVRWRLSPPGRKLEMLEQSEKTCRFSYGGLEINLVCLDQQGGFAMKPERIGSGTLEPWTPLLVRSAPWSRSDFVHVATIVRPVGAGGTIHVKSLLNGAAAMLMEPDGRKALVWIADLERQWRQYLLDLPAGVTVHTYKRDVEMPPVPPGEPASIGLIGGESALWVVESAQPLDPQKLLDGLRAGIGR